MNELHRQILLLFIDSVSPNVIYNTLKQFGVGVRKQDFFDTVREIKNIQLDKEKAKVLYTPVKYLTEALKKKKYQLRYDKIVAESFKRGRIENRKAARRFMETDNYEEDRELIPSEKIEDAHNEQTKYLKYELGAR